MATGLFSLEDLPLHTKIGKKRRGIKTIMESGINPCPWADYLRCIPVDSKYVDNKLEETEQFMKNRQDVGYQAKGGSEDSGDSGAVIDFYINSLKSAIQLGWIVEKEVDKINNDVQTERMKAAAAINYISRLFVLGLEDNVDTLRNYTRKKHNKEIDSIMYDMASYIKNTREDV